MDGTKLAVNACMGLHYSRAKQKPCTLSRCKAKEKPRHVGGVEVESGSTLAAPDVTIGGGHDGIAAADLDNNAITGAGLACIVSGGIQSSHCVISLVSHNISPPYLDALNSAEKNQKKNRIQDIMRAPPF